MLDVGLNLVAFAAQAWRLMTVRGRSHAYIDPGSGSFAIQILVAMAVGALMTVRLWWTRLLSIFYGLRPGSRARKRSDKRSPAGSGREADATEDDDGPAGR